MAQPCCGRLEETQVPDGGNAEQGDGVSFQQLHAAELPEFVVFAVIFEPGLGQGLLKLLLVDVEIVAQGVERIVVVAQLHVDYAEQHQGIFG